MSVLDGLSRPMRLAGVVLIGVAAVAAIIGTATALSGGDNGQTAAPTSSSARPDAPGGVPAPGPSEPPGSQPGGPDPSGPPAKPGVPPEQPTTPGPGGPKGQPGDGQQAPPPGGPESRSDAPARGQAGTDSGGQAGNQQAAAAKWVTVRVYNNSTKQGLAQRAAEDFRKQGWNIAEFSNYSEGIIPTTTAYFRPGTDEETAAQALAKSFGMRVKPRFPGIADSSAGVIVIVTNDYGDASAAQRGG